MPTEPSVMIQMAIPRARPIDYLLLNDCPTNFKFVVVCVRAFLISSDKLKFVGLYLFKTITPNNNGK